MANNPFDAFARRLDRRLQEMRATAGAALLGIEQRMANSDPRHRAHVAALQRWVIIATNFALDEAQELPGNPELRDDAQAIKAKLDDFAADLFRMKWFSEIPVALVNAASSSVAQMIAGDVEDYEAGVWHARSIDVAPAVVEAITEPAVGPQKHFGFAEAGGAGFGQAPFHSGQEEGEALPLGTEAGGDLPTMGVTPPDAITVPAADRLVRLDHNSEAYREAVAALDKVEAQLATLGNATDADTYAHLKTELAAGRSLFQEPVVRSAALGFVLGGVLAAISVLFHDFAVSLAASAAWALVVTCMKKGSQSGRGLVE